MRHLVQRPLLNTYLFLPYIITAFFIQNESSFAQDDDQVMTNVLQLQVRKELAELLRDAGAPLSYTPCTNHRGRKHVISNNEIMTLFLQGYPLKCVECGSVFERDVQAWLNELAQMHQ